MFRAIASLTLVLVLLACPFACCGAVQLPCGDPWCGSDPCCDADTPTPSNSAPADPCQGACGSCICMGATIELVRQLDLIGFDSVELFIALPTEHVELAANTCGSDLSHETERPIRTGVSLLALLQSYLL